MSDYIPPQEAALVERLRKARRPALSVRKAAEAAGISESYWRMIAKGYNQASKDVRVPVRAPDDTLAKMAQVVGATPDQLRDAGRDDAALELERLYTDELRSNATDYLAMLKATITDPPTQIIPGETPMYGVISYEAAVELSLRLERASADLPPEATPGYAANIDTAADLADRIADLLIRSPTLVRETRRKVAEVIRKRDTDLAAQHEVAARSALKPQSEGTTDDRSTDTPASAATTPGTQDQAGKDKKNEGKVSSLADHRRNEPALPVKELPRASAERNEPKGSPDQGLDDDHE